MSETYPAPNTRFHSALGRYSSSVALAIAALLLGSGCEDKGLGRSCSLGRTLESNQGAYTLNSTECPSRMCVKPAVQQGVSQDLDTSAYCSSSCNADSDCPGQTRDPSNPNDKRCKLGFACAIAFGEGDNVEGGGKLCCQKICLCKDFFKASVGPTLPPACESGADASCTSVQHD
jgi:hypothetical protein